jgi:hypothetical protein
MCLHRRVAIGELHGYDLIKYRIIVMIRYFIKAYRILFNLVLRQLGLDGHDTLNRRARGLLPGKLACTRRVVK